MDWKIDQEMPSNNNPLLLINKVMINGLVYEMNDNYAGITHALLLLIGEIKEIKKEK